MQNIVCINQKIKAFSRRFSERDRYVRTNYITSMPKAISQRGRLHSNLVSEAGFPAPAPARWLSVYFNDKRLSDDSPFSYLTIFTSWGASIFTSRAPSALRVYDTEITPLGVVIEPDARSSPMSGGEIFTLA